MQVQQAMALILQLGLQMKKSVKGQAGNTCSGTKLQQKGIKNNPTWSDNVTSSKICEKL